MGFHEVLQAGEGALAVVAGEPLGPYQAGGAVQQAALEVELAFVGDPAAAVGVGDDVHPTAALDRGVVDPADGGGAVLQDADLGVDLANRALYLQLVGVVPQGFDLLDADHPPLGVAEVADKGGHHLGGGGDALLDGDAALAAHPHPSSSRRSSSKPKWWATSCTTVIWICSSSSARRKSRSKGPRKIVILSGRIP